MNEPRFEVFPAETTTPPPGEEPRPAIFWRFRDANGRITFIGGESFNRREDAHRALTGAAYDVVRILVRPAHGIDLVLPIVDLDENDKVITT
jgi:hypothetical protein